jgi:hypothetical protein
MGFIYFFTTATKAGWGAFTTFKYLHLHLQNSYIDREGKAGKGSFKWEARKQAWRLGWADGVEKGFAASFGF